MKIDITITYPSEGLTVTGRNDQRVKAEIPTGWPQVTFKQYLDLLFVEDGMLKIHRDPVKVISVFTGLDEDLVRKSKIKNLKVLTACLHFLGKPMTYVTPTTVLGYKVAENLDTESIAQFADLQEICKGFKEDDPKHNYSLFPLIVATYAVEPYDFKEAEKIQDQFLYASCLEVLAIGNFTLVRLRALNSGIVPTSPLADTLLNRLRLALADWLKNLASSIRYYIWKRSLPLNEQNYLNGQ